MDRRRGVLSPSVPLHTSDVSKKNDQKENNNVVGEGDSFCRMKALRRMMTLKKEEHNYKSNCARIFLDSGQAIHRKFQLWLSHISKDGGGMC